MIKYKTKPWPHQKAAVEYLIDKDTAALYTDMGSGKSKIMIDLIINRGFQFVLIACTSRGCDSWETQFSLHSDIPKENIINLCGIPSNKKKDLIPNNGNKPIIILCNYEGIWRKPFSEPYLMKAPIDCIICDESHRIKSPGSKCSRFLARIGKKVPHRYLVTGTPSAETPMDVYAQYRFLDPSIFGTSFAKFKDRYQNLDARASMAAGFPILNKKQPYKNLDELKEKMFSVAFLMPSSVKLPSQNDRDYRFKLSKKASNVYRKFSKDGILYQGDFYCEAENSLTRALRKKQIASGFVSTVNDIQEKRIFYLDDTRKEALKDLLESLDSKEPVVVFAQYTYDLKQVKKACAEIGRVYAELSGKTDTEKKWQEGKATVLGVQFQKGSESADFTKARYCIYYTMTSRLALYEQSRKRIHRPGQERPCYYYHFIADLDDGKPTRDSDTMVAIKMKKDIEKYLMEVEENELSAGRLSN